MIKRSIFTDKLACLGKKEIESFKPITAEYSQVTNELRGPIEGKCDFDNA